MVCVGCHLTPDGRLSIQAPSAIGHACILPFNPSSVVQENAKGRAQLAASQGLHESADDRCPVHSGDTEQ